MFDDGLLRIFLGICDLEFEFFLGMMSPVQSVNPRPGQFAELCPGLVFKTLLLATKESDRD